MLVRDFLTNREYGSVIINARYVWNGGNVPRICWIYATPFSPQNEVPFLLHDYFCDGGELCNGYKLTRYEADRVLYDKLIHYGTRKSKAWLMYFCCRMYAIVTLQQ